MKRPLPKELQLFSNLSGSSYWKVSATLQRMKKYKGKLFLQPFPGTRQQAKNRDSKFSPEWETFNNYSPPNNIYWGALVGLMEINDLSDFWEEYRRI